MLSYLKLQINFLRNGYNSNTILQNCFFKETLLSLANQIDKRFHVCIFDDNSKDCPKRLLEEFNEKFSFTLFKFDKNHKHLILKELVFNRFLY